MEKLVLFYNKKLNTYFIKFNNNKCDKCRGEIYGIGKHIINYYNNDRFNEFIFHTECFIDISLSMGCIQQERIVIINNVIPNDSFPVLDCKPILKNSDISVFDIKNINNEFKDSPNIDVDKCSKVYESFEGFKIGNYNEFEDVLLENKKDIKNYLLKLKED